MSRRPGARILLVIALGSIFPYFDKELEPEDQVKASQTAFLSPFLPDASSSDDPCSDDCPCLCCPGHSYRAFVQDFTSWLFPPSEPQVFAYFVLDLRSQDFFPSVFRPPRLT